MVKTDINCVKLKSDRRSIYKMNEFYGIHCKKVADLSRGETGKSDFPVTARRTSPCLVAGMSWACRRRHREVGIMEFGLNSSQPRHRMTYSITFVVFNAGIFQNHFSFLSFLVI